MFLLQPSQASSPVLRFGADGPVIDAQLSSDGATLMAHCEDGSVNLWNAETGAWLTSLRSDSTQAVRALLSPKGSYLLVITDSAMVQIFDLKTATEQARFDGHQYTITASGSADSTVVTISGNNVKVDVVDGQLVAPNQPSVWSDQL